MPPSTPETELPHWDLTTSLGPPDDATLRDAVTRVVLGVGALVDQYDRAGIGTGDDLGAGIAPAEADALLRSHNLVLEELRLVGAVLAGRVSVDSRDAEALGLRSTLQSGAAPLGTLNARLQRWAARAPLVALAGGSAEVARHLDALERAAALADHQLTLDAEALAAELRLSGSVAWANLHRDLSAQLTGELTEPDGTSRTLGVHTLRGLAADPDQARRRAAFRAETRAWASIEHPMAATLNGALGERLVLDRRRGWADSLEPALEANRVDRGVLDAIHEAVAETLPAFRRYLRAKASLLGHAGGLPWWELAAPIGHTPTRSWDEACAQVTGAFARFGPELTELARRAMAERWIDAGPRVGKVGGAFCMGTGAGTSRVLLNFDGTTRSMLTLAHELGHAYHGMRAAHLPPLLRQTPMTLAETASVFCETLTLEAALDDAGSDDELAILELDLQGATQIVVDIHSRFLFEQAALAARGAKTLMPDELGDLMSTAQEQAYGDGLAPTERHRWMWAVKGHYFTPFYNWPYTFGLLFGLGLHRRFLDDPVGFRPRYDELLAATGTEPPVASARRFGIDLTSVGSWREALASIVTRIDRYDVLAAARRGDG